MLRSKVAMREREREADTETERHREAGRGCCRPRLLGVFASCSEGIVLHGHPGMDSVSFNQCQQDLAPPTPLRSEEGPREEGAGADQSVTRAVSIRASWRSPAIRWPGNGDLFWVTGCQGAGVCLCVILCHCVVGCCFFFLNGLIRQCLWSTLGIEVSLA